MLTAQRVFLSVAALCLIACGGTAPCDPRGSTTAQQITVTCSTSGSQLVCRANANNENELYICVPVNNDVTQTAVWTANPPGVISLVQPGVFEAVGTGDATVSAASGQFPSILPIPVSVFPGSPPYRTWEIDGDVHVQGQANSTGAINGATVQIVDV